jgi:hypothetical protein
VQFTGCATCSSRGTAIPGLKPVQLMLANMPTQAGYMKKPHLSRPTLSSRGAPAAKGARVTQPPAAPFPRMCKSLIAGNKQCSNNVPMPCRSNRAVASWRGSNLWHASKTLMIRLPSVQAYTAMYTLLEHPEVTLLHAASADAKMMV